MYDDFDTWYAVHADEQITTEHEDEYGWASEEYDDPA